MNDQPTGNVTHARLYLEKDTIKVNWETFQQKDVTVPDPSHLAPHALAVFQPHSPGTEPTVMAGAIVPPSIVRDIQTNLYAGRHLAPASAEVSEQDPTTKDAAQFLA